MDSPHFLVFLTYYFLWWHLVFLSFCLTDAGEVSSNACSSRNLKAFECKKLFECMKFYSNVKSSSNRWNLFIEYFFSQFSSNQPIFLKPKYSKKLRIFWIVIKKHLFHPIERFFQIENEFSHGIEWFMSLIEWSDRIFSIRVKYSIRVIFFTSNGRLYRIDTIIKQIKNTQLCGMSQLHSIRVHLKTSNILDYQKRLSSQRTIV